MDDVEDITISVPQKILEFSAIILVAAATGAADVINYSTEYTFLYAK